MTLSRAQRILCARSCPTLRKHESREAESRGVPLPPNARQWTLLVAASVALAWLLERAAFPAALLLGPMIAAIGTAAGGARLRIPRPAFIGAQSIVGCLVARAITAPIVASIVNDWAVMLAVVVSTVAAGAAVGFILTRFGALPGSTAAWGSSPGGASAMVAMSEAFGADVRLVAFMQYLRVIVVVVTASLVARLLTGGTPGTHTSAVIAPAARLFGAVSIGETLLLAAGGAWLGGRLKVPAGALLVPMTLGAVLHATGAMAISLPEPLLGLAYAAIGWYVGLQFTRDTLRHALRAVPQLLAGTLLLIGLCMISAWLLHRTLGTDPLSAYLATSPGGLDSVTIIAVGSGVNIPLVLAVQALRIFIVILSGPALAKLITRYA